MTAQLLNRSSSSAVTAYAHPQRLQHNWPSMQSILIPPFEVPPGCLTPNGTQAETLLGAYYRDYLLHEGLLTGNDQKDAARSYFRANSIERSWMTADAFGDRVDPERNRARTLLPY